MTDEGFVCPTIYSGLLSENLKTCVYTFFGYAALFNFSSGLHKSNLFERFLSLLRETITMALTCSHRQETFFFLECDNYCLFAAFFLSRPNTDLTIRTLMVSWFCILFFLHSLTLSGAAFTNIVLSFVNQGSRVC